MSEISDLCSVNDNIPVEQKCNIVYNIKCLIEIKTFSC